MQSPTRFTSPTVLQANVTGELVKYEDYAALQGELEKVRAQLKTHKSTRNDLGTPAPSPRDVASFTEIKERILSVCGECDFGATAKTLEQNIPNTSPASIRLCTNSLVAQGKIEVTATGRYGVAK